MLLAADPVKVLLKAQTRRRTRSINGSSSTARLRLAAQGDQYPVAGLIVENSGEPKNAGRRSYGSRRSRAPRPEQRLL